MGPVTQEDPIGIAGGLNLYGYANGDPINYSDPFGLCERPDDPKCRTTSFGVGLSLATPVGGFDIEFGIAKERGSGGEEPGAFARLSWAGGGRVPGLVYWNAGFEYGEQPVGFDSFVNDTEAEVEGGIAFLDASRITNGGWEVGLGAGSGGFVATQPVKSTGFRFSDVGRMFRHMALTLSGKCQGGETVCR